MTSVLRLIIIIIFLKKTLDSILIVMHQSELTQGKNHFELVKQYSLFRKNHCMAVATTEVFVQIMGIPLKKLLAGVILVIFGHFASSDFKVWLQPCIAS